MRVRTFLLAGTVVGTLIIIVAGSVLYITFQDMNEAMASDGAAREVQRAMFELTVLTNDFIMHGSVRAEEQWWRKHASLARLLEDSRLDLFGIQTELKRIEEDHARIGGVFTQLVRLMERSGQLRNDELIRIQQDRLVAQLLIRAQAMSSQAFRLATDSRIRVRQHAQRTAALILLLLLGIGASMLTSWVLLRAIVVVPIKKLQDGIELVGKRRLGHRIGLRGSGEIHDVARAFDSMVEHLESVMVSRDAMVVEARERKGAELAARISESRVRLLLQSTAEAIYGMDIEGNCTFANPACVQVLRYEAEDQLLGKNMHTLIHHHYPDGRPYPVEACHVFSGFVKGEAVHVDDEVLFRADGSSFPAEIWCHPMRQDGTVTGAVMSFLDITERKLAEKQIADKNRDLESLLYVTSHDLREPLRAIENFSRMVNDRYAERLDGKGRDFLRRVVAAAGRMNRLLDDVLQLSRAGRMDTPMETLDTARLVGDVLKRLEATIAKRNADVRVAEALPMVTANRLWATQAIYNLVWNALKFTRDGQAPVVEIAPYYDDGAVGIIVRDCGPGVAPEHAERIFQLFQRVVGRDVEGTGAGLAIVRQVAERHGGRAWVQPREGGGSEFILTFGKPVRSGDNNNARIAH